MASDPTQPGDRQSDFLGAEEDADIPPSPLGDATDPLGEDAEARLRRMSRRGRMLPVALVVVALGAFVAIVWWAYRTANVPEAPAEIPVVEAQPDEEKVRPESEGGMDVPNQDVLIYEGLGQNEGQSDVERLLPPPEEPLEPPVPPAAPPAAEAPFPDTAELSPPAPPQELTPTAPDAAEAEPPIAEPDTAATEAPPPVVAAPAAPEAAAPEPAPEAAAEPAPATAPEPAPQVAAVGDGFRIQLAAVKNEADARSEWARLQKAHADLLGGLEPTIQRADLGAQGIFYRIQGGPLPSRDAAATLCERLKAKKQACLVVKP